MEGAVIPSFLGIGIGLLFCFLAYFGWKKRNPLEGRWFQFEILRPEGSSADWIRVRKPRLILMGIIGPLLIFIGILMLLKEIGAL